MLTYHKTTEEEKYRITAWKYDGDYAVYNSTPYEQQKQTGFGDRVQHLPEPVSGKTAVSRGPHVEPPGSPVLRKSRLPHRRRADPSDDLCR